MVGIDENKNSDKNSVSDITKTTTNNSKSNNADNGEYSNNKHNTTNTFDDVELDCDKLLEPNTEFVRSDKTISSTTSRDLDFCFDVILKEAVKEDKLVRQVLYTMLSAYTNNPINLAINAPSGEGKTHVLMKASSLFPDKDVQFIADMSDKAIFHKNGYLGIKDETDGIYINIEPELLILKESLETKKTELKKINKGDLSSINQTKKEIGEIQKQINEIQDKAVKVIDLNHKILIFLDTPKKQIFEALMSLLSHDKFEVEYHYVDTSSKTGIITKTNVLIGWPSVIFAQAIDYTLHPRYQEIQRRFIVTNPRMDIEKYQAAIENIIDKNCLPDLAYQLKVVSDKEKDIAREIIFNLRDDLLSFTDTIKIGRNNTLVPFPWIINQILSKNITAQDMTFVDRLLNIVGLSTLINRKKRPVMEITEIFSSESSHIPMSLHTDLKEALRLINNSAGGIRPYVLDWYRKVFLALYNSQTVPNSKEKNGEMITEQRKAITTQELIQKTIEIWNKKYATKNILSEFIYPLSNMGYIDSLTSEIDRRANIYFPVIDESDEVEEKEKNINLFFSDKKNNFFNKNDDIDINYIINKEKTQIISNILGVMKYYSENGFSVAFRIAEMDIETNTGSTATIKEEDYATIEEIVDRYYSDLISKEKEKIKDHDNLEFSDKNVYKPLSTEEYPHLAKNQNDLQNNQINDINNYNNKVKYSNNLFFQQEKNNLIYSCYYCGNFIPTEDKSLYEKHCVINHPGRPAYPSLVDLEKYGIPPKGKDWEV